MPRRCGLSAVSGAGAQRSVANAISVPAPGHAPRTGASWSSDWWRYWSSNRGCDWSSHQLVVLLEQWLVLCSWSSNRWCSWDVNGRWIQVLQYKQRRNICRKKPFGTSGPLPVNGGSAVGTATVSIWDINQCCHQEQQLALIQVQQLGLKMVVYRDRDWRSHWCGQPVVSEAQQLVV